MIKIKVMAFVLMMLSLCDISHSNTYSQAAKGDGNIQSQKNYGQINVISDPAPQSIYYSSDVAIKDLKNRNYKDVLFEDKKPQHSHRKKILVMTATNFETKIIHQEAQKQGLEIKKEILNDHIVYYLGTLGGVDIIQMQPGMMGMIDPSSTPLILQSVFRDINPEYIIATGIAFGRQSKGQALGDILISRQLVNYESRKESNGKIIFRGDKVTSPMLERVNAGVHNWTGAKIHQGVVLSGNVLVNSEEFLKLLSKREPEYVGGDMETYGIYSVASMMGSKWIMIKGISDWGDGTKNDDFHKIALQNAGQFIFHVIQEGNLK